MHPDTEEALSHPSGMLQRSAFTLCGLKGVAGPFDATGVGKWFAERLRPQTNAAAL